MGFAGIAFTGRKSMPGPTGIDGLILNGGTEIELVRLSGTGVDSASLVHTEIFPHRFECSTLNLLRVIGLCEALDFLEKETAESIRRREIALLARLRDGLIRIDGVTIYCADDLADHVGLLTASRENTNPGKVGAIMDGDFDIAVRVRLNRASLVHESLSASPREGVRFSVGPCTTKEDIDRAAFPVVEIAKAKGEALNRIRLVLAPYSYVPS